MNIDKDIFPDNWGKENSIIKVIGVGGGGCNAVNYMYRQNIQGCSFIVCNTDAQALQTSEVPVKIQMGNNGLGAGTDPTAGRNAALESQDEIAAKVLDCGTKMLFITAGMGGGTGTGAAPVIAEIAKSIELDDEDTKNILVVAIVTLPFSFEGAKRREQALAGIKELSQHVDSIIVINNDKLRSFGNLTMSQAFGMADDVLLTAAKGIAEIITNNAYVNIDFQDVNTVMEHSGTALMGAGSGKGENRALEAITAATTSVLLDDNDITGAKNVLLYFSYSKEHEMTMDEQAEITDYILEKTNGSADFIWGAGTDDSLDDELKVILIATGFEKSASTDNTPKVIRLPEDTVKPEPKPAPAETKAADEPFIITKPEVAEAPKAEVKIEAPIFVPEAPKAESTPVKNIFVLEDEEADEPAPQMPEPAMQNDDLVSGISLVAPEAEAAVLEAPVAVMPEPKVEPKPVAPVQESPARSAFENNNDVQTVADRIRHIHDLLRNNPNGADLVQKMSAVATDELFEGRHSSSREASTYTMRADGTMAKNAWLGDQPD